MKIGKRLSLSLLLLLSFWLVPTNDAEAQLSRAVCELAVYPGTYITESVDITVHGRVRETRPGLDPSSTYVSIYTNGGGTDTRYGVESADAYIYGLRLSNGTYTAYVDGTSWSNPNGGSSTCGGYVQFTVNVVEPVYVCSNDIDDDGDGLKDMNDPGCDNPQDPDEYNAPPPPPPGNFNVTTSYCFGWPSPRIEVNLNPSSGANYYALQKWNGSSYQTIYTGSYSDVDRYEDTNISMYNTYWYRVVAYNDYGSTPSNNEISHYPTPAGCGQVLRSLAVSIGTPSGSVVGTGGISCLSACNGSYESGSGVSLTATPSTGYRLSHWTGACAGQLENCWLTMDSDKSTSAHFAINTNTLSVSVSGPGTVTGPNISCNPSCNYTYNYGTQVTLTPVENTGASFAGWSGACTNTTGNCTVTMTAARSVGATFTTNSYTLTVSKNGTGSGTVTGPSINCGSTCSASFQYPTSVILPEPTPSYGSAFSGWSGACTNSTGSCTIPMTAARSVTATFNLVPFDYSLSNQGNSAVTKASGNTYATNIITKTLIAGATQAVSLNVTGTPPNASYSFSGGGSCAPTCSTTITFTISPTTPAGTYPITVSSSGVSPARQTNFNLVITGSPFSVTCSTNPVTTAVLGQNVTFSATVSGGVPPLTYTWSGLGLPTSPAPSTNPYTTSFSTIGTKNITLTVRDADNVQSTCPPATITITFDPNFEEF